MSLLSENRSRLIVNACILPAGGFGERDAAVIMAAALPGGPVTLGADKGYGYPGFIGELRHLGVTPHVAQNTMNRRGAIDGPTTRLSGSAVSLRKRKLVEQAFAWMKTVGGLRTLRHPGGPSEAWIFTFSAAAYNIVRLRRLLPAGV